MPVKTWMDDPAPYVPGAKSHSLVNEDYWAAMFRANYYGWSARKPFVGRDPMTGREERSDVHRRAHRAANVAEARVWLAHAAALRERMDDVLTRRSH